MAVKRKDQSIESLRGVAIILVVITHIVYAGVTTDDSWWRHFNHTFQFIRMPLFTSISGFVYAIRPVKTDVIPKFIGGKARRILIPFISVSTIQYLMHALVPNVNHPVLLSDIWKIYFTHYMQFWFLQVLFLIILTIVLLEKFHLISSLKKWLIVLIFSFLIFLFEPVTETYSYTLSKYFYLLPFFLLGIGINRFHDEIISKSKTKLIIGSSFATIFVLLQLNLFNIINLHLEGFSLRLFALIFGSLGLLFLFVFRKPNKYLADLGYYSYSIYLFHILGTAGSRIVFNYLGVENSDVLFALMVLGGLGFPIFLEKYILLKNKYLKLIFLGLK